MTAAAPAKLSRLDDCWNRIGVWSPERASCPELQQVIHCRNCARYSSAGRSMLEHPMTADYREEWTERLASARQTRQIGSSALLLFRLGDEWLGLDCRHVQEVSEMRSIHSLPHRTSSLVKGIVNIRGELKLCVSIGSLLQLQKSEEDYRVDHEIHQRMIHILKDGQSFAFPVSEVHGIHHYPENAVKPAPATLSKARQSFTAGVLSWKQRHIGVLDHELLFYALTKGLE
jgi:chemotaxis-related protein WspD